MSKTHYLFLLFLFFWCLAGASIYGVIKYFVWVFSQSLFSTAGIIGVAFASPIVLAEVLFLCLCFGGIKFAIEEINK